MQEIYDERDKSLVAIYLIEQGPLLDAVKAYIQEVKALRQETHKIAKDLGVERVSLAIDTGEVLGVKFSGAVHPDFTKPDRRGMSRPKRKTAWAERFAAQKRLQMTPAQLAEIIQLPLSLEYRTAQGEGCRMLAHPLQPCSFLYLSEHGPFGLWIPDVEAEVAIERARGHEVVGPAAEFSMELEGCRRILREEWDSMVALDNLKRAQERARGSSQAGVPA